MNRQEHLLTCLAEECAEVAQRAAKALRFGLHEIQPGQGSDNAERLLVELEDLFSVVHMLRCEGVLGSPPRVSPAKVGQVLKYLEYSREIGTLAGEEPADG